MATLKEVLDDKVNYADNVAFTLASGVQTTLGALRSLQSEQQTAISKREQEITTQTTEITKRQTELKQAQLNTANAYALIQKATDAIKAGNYNDPSIAQLVGGEVVIPGNGNHNNDPFAALSRLENDALLAPLVKVMKLVNDENQKAQKSVADNIEVQKRMATNYLNGVLEDRYDRLIAEDKRDKFPLSTLIQKAVEGQMFRSDSTPDIRAAYKSLTAGDDAKTKEDQIRADERKKVQAELQGGGGSRGSNGEIFVPQPQSFGLDVHNRSGAAPKPFASLDAAFAAAEKDPEMWTALNGGSSN